ncbi:MAG: AIPR family protein [Anaerolineae bacterium]|nr:AIPR family protein [Anaerolineae bacterium]
MRADHIKNYKPILPSTKLALTLEGIPVRKNNVFLGIISSTMLKELHTEFGNALFFENVRDFQGLGEDRQGRTSPNKEIVKTITQYPDKMLERNNGIVFKADRVEQGDTDNQLILSGGSIVNGCQTTKCLVDYTEETCYVPVKVVEITDPKASWEITQAANYQNSIRLIDLRIARTLRPQLVQRTGAISGIGVDRSEVSVFQLMNRIYNRRVTYEETRRLYIGLFSKTPNNVIATNYTELRYDLIDKFYEEDPYGQETIEVLFLLQNASQVGLQRVENIFKHSTSTKLFKRYYSSREESLPYRCFVSILALCGTLNIDISEREEDTSKEYERMQGYLSQARAKLEEDQELFSRYYELAAKTWMDAMAPAEENEAQIQQKMNVRAKRVKFSGLLRKLGDEANYYFARIAPNSDQ